MSSQKKRKTRIPSQPEIPKTPSKMTNKPSNLSKTETITDAFYDPKTGLSLEPYKLYKKLKAAGHDVTIKEVEDVLKNQLVEQVYRPIGEYKKRYLQLRLSF